MGRVTDPVVSDETAGSRTRLLRGVILYIVVALATLVLLSLILLSPLLLRQIGNAKGINWALLGNIGQTYGAASAILSALALMGITISLVLQRYQARAERVRIVRERQMELLRIVLENPRVYAPVIGFGNASSADNIRRSYFASMWMNYSRLGYEMGILTERMLREEIFPDMFGGEPAREWWGAASSAWTNDAAHSRRDRQFAQIANEEFERAVKAGPSPSKWNIEEPSPVGAEAKDSGLMNLALGIVLGIGIGVVARSRKRSK